MEHMKYNELPLDEPSEAICPSCAAQHRHPPRRFTLKNPFLWVTALNLFIFLCSVTNLIISNGSSALSPREVLKKTSSYSPIFDMVDLTTSTETKVDGRLHSTTDESIFRGDPSPEVDAAWDAASAARNEVIVVNATVLQKAGYEPAKYFKAPADWGHGNDAYPVQVDVFHQIHCLDAIRKQMHYDYYYGEKYGGGPPPAMHWMHQKHCLHMILQSLMCNANVDLVPHRWVEEDQYPFAEFSIQRKCRNFNNLKKWNEENGLLDVRTQWRAAARPKEAYVWPGHGEGDEHGDHHHEG